MPVEFLTDEQAASYGKFDEEPTRPELERFFFLDDEDRKLTAKRRGTTVGSGSLPGCARCATSAGSSRTTRWTRRGSWSSTWPRSSASRTSPA
nr:DUF4158 domain-containing protein [Streptomyces radiopugnans]